MNLEISYLKVSAGQPTESFTIYSSKKTIDEDIARALIFFRRKLSRYGVITRENKGNIIFSSGDNSNFIEISVPADKVSISAVKDFLNGLVMLNKGGLPPLR